MSRVNPRTPWRSSNTWTSLKVRPRARPLTNCECSSTPSSRRSARSLLLSNGSESSTARGRFSTTPSILLLSSRLTIVDDKLVSELERDPQVGEGYLFLEEHPDFYGVWRVESFDRYFHHTLR